MDKTEGQLRKELVKKQKEITKLQRELRDYKDAVSAEADYADDLNKENEILDEELSNLERILKQQKQMLLPKKRRSSMTKKQARTKQTRKPKSEKTETLPANREKVGLRKTSRSAELPKFISDVKERWEDGEHNFAITEEGWKSLWQEIAEGCEKECKDCFALKVAQKAIGELLDKNERLKGELERLKQRGAGRLD